VARRYRGKELHRAGPPFDHTAFSLTLKVRDTTENIVDARRTDFAQRPYRPYYSLQGGALGDQQ